MITRRAAIASGIAASLSLTSAFPLSAMARNTFTSPFRFHKLLFDGRYAAGKSFGEEVTNLGLDAYDIDGDVTGIWYRDLRLHWKQADAAIAGLTTFSGYLSLRMMSDNLRIRPQYLGYHHLENGIRHELFGPESLIGTASLEPSAKHWPVMVARLLQRWSSNPGMTAGSPSTVQAAAERYLGAHSLVSWILAPKLR